MGRDPVRHSAESCGVDVRCANPPVRLPSMVGSNDMMGGVMVTRLLGTRTWRFATGALASLALAASGLVLAAGPVGAVGAPDHLAFITQPPAVATTGVVFATSVEVAVEDSGNNVVTSATGTATAAVATGSGTISGTTTATISGGYATFTSLSITGADTTDTISVSGDGVDSNDSTSIAVSSAVATQLVLTTAPSSTGQSGLALAIQPVVKIEDADSFVVAANASTVTASITGAGSGASVTNATATAVNGVATFSGLALNDLAGGYTITFTDGTLSSAASGTITLSTGPAAKLVVTTEPAATATNGVALSQQPVVKIEDSGGNIVTSATSVVTAAIYEGPAGSSVTGASVAAVNGVATFTSLVLNAPAGLYDVVFTDGQLTSTTSTGVTISVGAASQLVVTTEPSSSVASGVALAQQPVVKLEDSGGDVITSGNATVTAVVSSGTNTAVSNTAVLNAGVATFSGLALDAPVGTYTLTFSAGTYSSAQSSSIQVTPGAAKKLVIQTQPSSADASGAILATQPVVDVEDAYGNVVTTDGSTVTAQITSGGVGVNNGTRAASSGVATFANLGLNAAVGTYTLTFTDGSLTPATSSSIIVTPGVAAQIVITTHPSTVATSGVAFVTQPVVKLEDSGGNVATSINSGVATVAIYQGTGGSIVAGSSANFVAGAATFSGLALSGPTGAVYTLVYTGGGFSVVDTTHVTIGTPQSALTLTSLSATYGRPFILTTSGGSGSGAVTYAVVGGTATDCAVAVNVLTYESPGTCVIVATKAGDATYASASSVPTTVTVTALAIPGVVRVNFSGTSSALTSAAKIALTALATHLTVDSAVTITGYAPANLRVAQSRANAVVAFLRTKVRATYTLHYVTRTTARIVQVRTTAQ